METTTQFSYFQSSHVVNPVIKLVHLPAEKTLVVLHKKVLSFPRKQMTLEQIH